MIQLITIDSIDSFEKKIVLTTNNKKLGNAGIQSVHFILFKENE